MSVAIDIRKIVTTIEEIRHEFGPVPDKPRLRGAILAVIKNPYAGGYVKDITPMMEALKPLGLDMSHRLIAALGVKPEDIQAYGKGAIVGEAGELEHGALWHVPGGYGMREVLGGAKAIVPSSKKVGGLGSRLDIPIGHVDAAYVRSHFDAMEIGLNDAPRRDEIVYGLVMATGGRVHERVGGLRHEEIGGEDGLR
jgi:Amino acid synthesis